jgi:hypothetical protein
MKDQMMSCNRYPDREPAFRLIVCPFFFPLPLPLPFLSQCRAPPYSPDAVRLAEPLV